MEKVICFSLYGEGKKQKPRVSGRQWDCSSSKPLTLQALGAHGVGARALQWAGHFQPLACLGFGDPRSWIGVPAGGRWGPRLGSVFVLFVTLRAEACMLR